MRPFIKVLRDLWMTRGRVAFMVLALAAGLTSMGAVLAMRGVLPREMTRNYMDTLPASATIDVGEAGLDDARLAQLRARPEVVVAERRATKSARWRRPGDPRWGRALLFVIEDFEDQQLARIEHEEGIRIPGPGEVLIERSAVAVLDAGVGDSVEMVTARGRPVELRIVGIVHEPALAPAISEQAGYFYASPATLELLGESPILDEVRIVVSDAPLELASVEAQVTEVAQWLTRQDVEVHEVEIPPPGRHPHQAPSEAVLLLFSLFAGLTVGLAAVLSASLLAAIMARQVREVAVMKTLGASSRQIRILYAVMLVLAATIALLVSALPTLALARLGIAAVASMLNIDIISDAVPAWVYAVQILTGFALPLLAAAPAIVRASRVSVRQALDDHGAKLRDAKRPGLERWVGGLENRVVQAALRNALRVPRRLALTVGLLAVGGGLFISAVSVAAAWEAMTQEVYETRHYDVELRLAAPVDDAALDALDALDSLTQVEAWGFAPVTLASESGLPLSRTYPDGGHGSFTLVAVPDQTRLVDFDLRAGRWLRAGDHEQVVLNQLAAARVGPDTLGRRVELVVEGRRASWEVVGIVDEVAAPAAAYVSAGAFVERTGQPIRGLRVATDTNRDPDETRAVLDSIDQSLADAGVGVVASVPLELLFNAMGEHVALLIACLLGLAMLMAVVSILALSSTLAISVVERTREIGVLQAIGARPRQIRRMVVIEGLFVTALSLPFALLIGIPLAAIVGRVIGWLSFLLPLPLELSWVAVAGWSGGSLVVAALACLGPARAASKLTVREASSHV